MLLDDFNVTFRSSRRYEVTSCLTAMLTEETGDCGMGGRNQWCVTVIVLCVHVGSSLNEELGASAAYLWGGSSDIWYFQKKQDNIIRAFEIMKRSF